MPTLEDFLKIKSPSALAWSPDGRYLAYQVTGPAGNDIRLHTRADGAGTLLVGGLPPYQYVTEGPDLRWSPDGEWVLYASGRDYYAVPREGGEPELLADGGLAGELVQLSPDSRMISFIRNGELWVQPVPGGKARQITRGERFLEYDPDPWTADFWLRLLQWPQWSPDGTMIAYLGRMLHGFKVMVVSIEGDEMARVVPEEDIWEFSLIKWAPDSRGLAISSLSYDHKREELYLADLRGREARRISATADDKWVDLCMGPRHEASWSHDGRLLAFLADVEGWRHLHVVDREGGEPRQLSTGQFDVYSCLFSPSDDSIAFRSSEGNLQQQLLWSVPPSGGQAKKLVDMPGICADHYLSAPPQWSPDGDLIAFPFSGVDEAPGVWLADTAATTKPKRIYSSLPEGIGQADVPHMEAVTFQSADGLTIPGALITARDLAKDQKHPALVYMYGGFGQQASLGWNLKNKSLLFNYLASKGYVVLIADVRGSEGYGSELERAMYLEAGGKQVDDLVAGAKYLADLGYVDPKAIGIYGHSLGGFLTLQTVMNSPGVFAAAVGMSGVYDWDNYGNVYNYDLQVMFGSPDSIPDLAQQRSPVRQAEKLQTPVLLFHGTADFNVDIYHSEALVKELMKAGKEFEYMVYPGEPHDWVRPEIVRDFFERTKRFLDKHLKAG